MRQITVCAVCGTADIEYLGDNKCHCNHCEKEQPTKDEWVMTPFERQEAAVYATGNRWAIENWIATHY